MANLTHSESRQLIQAAAVGQLRLVDRAACNKHMATCQSCQAYAADLGALQSVLTRTLQPRVAYRPVAAITKQEVDVPAQVYETQNQAPKFSIRQTVAFVALIVVVLAGINWFMQPSLAPETTPAAIAPVVTLDNRSEAQKQYAAGHLTQAISFYKKALEAGPVSVDDFIQLARIQVYSGHPFDGLATAQSAINLNANNSSAHAIRALALDWDGQVEKASDEVVRAIQLDSKNALAFAVYTEILVDRNRWSQARDTAQQALKLDPQNMDAHRANGYYLESVGEYTLAIEEYKAALKIEPNLPFLLLSVSANYRKLGQYENADSFFKKALAIDPNVNLPVGDAVPSAPGASQHLEEILALDPTNADLHGLLGLAYFQSLNYEKALVELGCVIDGCAIQPSTTSVQASSQKMAIVPIPLNEATLEYYYTYSTVLAALSKPANNYCQRVPDLDNAIRAYVAQNKQSDFVLQILTENEAICGISQPAHAP